MEPLILWMLLIPVGFVSTPSFDSPEFAALCRRADSAATIQSVTQFILTPYGMKPREVVMCVLDRREKEATDDNPKIEV